MTKKLLVSLLFIVVSGIAGEKPVKDSLKIVPVNLQELKLLIHADSGNVVLVNLWATWCKPCNEEMPGLAQLKHDLRKKPFDLILVSTDDSDLINSDIPKALRNNGVQFKTFLMHDETDEELINGMSEKWSGALPASFLYDRTGNLVDVLVGGKTQAQFKTAIQKLLR